MTRRAGRTTLVTALVAGVVLTAAPSATAKTTYRCCWRVQVVSTGAMSADFGNEAVGRNGTHSYDWRWVTRTLVGHSENSRRDTHFLETCPSRSAVFNAPVCPVEKIKASLRERSRLWYGNEDDTEACGQEVTTAGWEKNGYDPVTFGGDNLDDDISVYRLATSVNGDSRFDARCWKGFGAHGPGGLEMTQREGAYSEGGVDESGNPIYSFNAWDQVLPVHPDPEKFESGAPRFSESFRWSFASPAGHQDGDDAYQHVVSGQATTTVTFTKFPARNLARERRALRRLG